MWHQQQQLVYNYAGDDFATVGDMKIEEFGKSAADSANVDDISKLKRQSSVFNDSDYEEVVEEMDAAIREGSEAVQFDDIESGVDSKRSSATSGVESSNEVEKEEMILEEEEVTVSKYDNVDIAKILHTRKRIHQTIIDAPAEEENNSQQQQYQQPSIKKRTAKFAKRYTSYGTLGRRSAAKSPISAPVENVNNRFSFGAGPQDNIFASRVSISPSSGGHGNNGVSPGFSYNTVGRRRNKATASSVAFHDYGLAEEANERWGITEPTSPTDVSDGQEKPKRKRRWASFKRLVSSGSSESRERIKEEKKASIQLQRCGDDVTMTRGHDFHDSYQSMEFYCPPTNRFSSSQSSGLDLTMMNRGAPQRSRPALDSDLFLANSARALSLEERVMSDLKTDEQQQTEDHQPKQGFSRKKSFKKMLRSIMPGSTLQRKRKDKAADSSTTTT